MNRSFFNKCPPFIVWAATAFTAWNASALLASWKNSPAEVTPKLGFLIWLMPIVYYFITSSHKHISSRYQNLLVACGILISLLAVVVRLNSLAYIGLTLCLAAFLPYFGLATLIWAASSLIWMPATSWMMAKYAPLLSPMQYYGLRLGFNLIAAFILCVAMKRYQSEDIS